MTREELVEKLRVERHRLEGALERFYSHKLGGDAVAMEAGALDISVPIRVMVHHNPPASIALLHQIDSAFMIKPIHFDPTIARPPRTLPSGIRAMTITIPVHVTMADSGTSFTRYRPGDDPNSRVPLQEWWSGICWDSGTNKISNRDIVLGLANKEGGTHIGGKRPSGRYMEAKRQGRAYFSGKPVSDVARIGSFGGNCRGRATRTLARELP